MHFEGHNIIPAFPSVGRRAGGATSRLEKDCITFFSQGFRNSLQTFTVRIIVIKILSNSAIASTESVYRKRCKKCRLGKRSLTHGVPCTEHRSCSDSAGLCSEQQCHFFRHPCRCQFGVATDVAWKSVLNIHGSKQTMILLSRISGLL